MGGGPKLCAEPGDAIGKALMGIGAKKEADGDAGD